MTTTEHPEQTAASRVSREMVEYFKGVLVYEGWMKSQEVLKLWNWDSAAPCDATPRMLRAIANASSGEIISSSKGYKLTSQATPEESRRCVNRLRHQAAAMTARAIQIELTTTKLNQEIK